MWWLLHLLMWSTVRAEDASFVPLTRAFLDRLRNETHYNRYATPTQYDGIPTNVSLSMFIEGMSSFSAQTMDYHLDMYFQQEWYDLRLEHNNSAPILVKDKKVFAEMWHPDVYFANAKSASFQEVTDDNFLIWVYPNGRVWYDTRISIVVSCNMDLWKYPLDSQECPLRILSYAYPETVLRLVWSLKDDILPVDRNPEIIMPDMQLKDIRTGYCNGTYATGVWSCMTAVFYVEREVMHHVMQTYLPTALIVVISWFNFWLDVDSAPARVSLSITTLLTISTQANAVKLALPEVSYMKAIDVWMGSCMAIRRGGEWAIAQSAKQQTSTYPPLIAHPPTRLIDHSSQHKVGLIKLTYSRGQLCFFQSMFCRYFVGSDRLKRKRSKNSFSRFRHHTTEVSRRALHWTRTLRNLRGRRVAQRIDEQCRTAFPVAFLLFNIGYWSFYLLYS
ncbi:Cation transporter family protein [Teladorsagia circumcincta]|uniref:Cation transporter family protein n=1 Tax=Teladorsagia circumcincta TaxID=45464 RepID=A0A2G9UZF2_TELCI|nr:Cation transporter family protein [Teladorsagia circumcincta]